MKTRIAPDDRYCDIVMKGGITSGIVYPPLVEELSQYYRFKNIGGTSAGAIAAAAAAAAEYRRRQAGPGAPFGHELGLLPAQLGEHVDGGKTTKLFSLFQPAPGCHRLFRVLVTSLNARGTWQRVGQVLSGFLLAYWVASLVCVALALAVASRSGWLAGVLSLVLSLLLSIGFWVYWDFTRKLVANDYGMCTGMTVGNTGHEALTPWLDALIQRLAGKPLDQPLTFEDLWAAKGFPPAWLRVPPDITVRSIDLRMFTTNLSTGRPFVLPLTDETCRLFYQHDELKAYLPEEVMAHIEAHSVAYRPNSPSDPSIDEMHRRHLRLRELPAAKFPVVLAARMSLSFPILFSAIPLWAIDYDRQPGKRTFRRCLFSDGGISSNFPIHMFDGLLPLWPTFGVQLEPKLKDRANMVYLPHKYAEGYGERWYRFDQQLSAGSRMGGFLSAVVNAMQNWNDNTASRMPGVRDRVVRVRLKDDEGGVNLNMEAKKIKDVAKRGGEAARELIARFQPPASGWNDQRWLRFRVTLEALQGRFKQAGLALNHSAPHVETYDDLIRDAMSRVHEGEERALLPAEADALMEVLKAIRQFDAAVSSATGSCPQFDVMPSTDLKIRPSL